MKARTNQRKHGITFKEAVNIFNDPHALFEQDRTDEATGEIRWQAIGLAERNGHLPVFSSRWPDSDFYVLPKRSQEFHQTSDRKTARPVTHEQGNVRLLDPQHSGRFGLRHAALL